MLSGGGFEFDGALVEGMDDAQPPGVQGLVLCQRLGGSLATPVGRLGSKRAPPPSARSRLAAGHVP